jgi:hypothetical protein
MLIFDIDPYAHTDAKEHDPKAVEWAKQKALTRLVCHDAGRA